MALEAYSTAANLLSKTASRSESTSRDIKKSHVKNERDDQIHAQPRNAHIETNYADHKSISIILNIIVNTN